MTQRNELLFHRRSAAGGSERIRHRCQKTSPGTSVHRAAGFFITAFMKDGIDVEGYEYVAVLSFAALAVAIAGPGDYSLDAAITIGEETLAATLDGWVGLGVAALGIVVAALQMIIFWRPRASAA